MADKRKRDLSTLQLAAEIGKTPPQANDLEIAILGALLLEPGVINVVLDRVKSESFYKTGHGEIFEAICDVISDGAKPDILLVTQKLRQKGQLEIVGGPYYISQLTNQVVSTANIEYHCRIVAQKAMQREIIKKSTELIANSYENTADVFTILDDWGQWYNQLNSGVLVTCEFINDESILSTEEELINLDGRSFLTVGNISGIIAPPGTGKTSVMNGLIAGIVNPYCDGLGFKGNLYGKGLFYADTESAHNDSVKHWQRLKKRINTDAHYQYMEGKNIKGVTIGRYKEIALWRDRRRALEKEIRSERYKLFILDGITDFMGDPNSINESQELIGWLGAMASKFQMGVMCTIHDNVSPKGSEHKGRPRGHIGSELSRKAEALVYLRESKANKSVREITNDFEFQKTRNTSDKAFSHYITWSDDKGMFVTITLDETEEKQEGDILKLERNINSIFDIVKKPIRAADLLNELMLAYDIKLSKAKKMISDAVTAEILFQPKRGFYYNVMNYAGESSSEDDKPF